MSNWRHYVITLEIKEKDIITGFYVILQVMLQNIDIYNKLDQLIHLTTSTDNFLIKSLIFIYIFKNVDLSLFIS